jgi:hypothetical protein
VQYQKFNSLHKISCNNCCEVHFIFNIVWHGFVLILLIGLVLRFATIRLVGFMHGVCSFMFCTRISLFGNFV